MKPEALTKLLLGALITLTMALLMNQFNTRAGELSRLRDRLDRLEATMTGTSIDIAVIKVKESLR